MEKSNHSKSMLNLNVIQVQKAKELNFNSNDLYRPNAGDCLITLDVKYESTKAIVGIDVVQYPNKHVKTFSVEAELPTMKYTPQYFAFYEGPVIVETIKKINQFIDGINLIIIDGHGIAHPRKFGLACYVGLELNMPCVGIAKSNLLPYDKTGLSKEKHATQVFELENKVVGVAIRLQENVSPVFISPGNKIDLITSISIIKDLTTSYKLPDNIRRADQASKSNQQ